MYLEFFKLKEKPFNVTPDPHFLYMSSGHQEAFANLLYGIRERKGFTVLTGEVGTGKTTLLHNLLGTLEEDIQTVYIFHTGLDFEEMLLTVHRELGIQITQSTRGGLIESLNDYLIEQLRRDRNVALIIDEAQNLSSDFLENLRLLSNLETAKEKLLQIVLVGQPELETKLGLTELRQLDSRIMVKGNIEPLSREESSAYIQHRLALAGAKDGDIFESAALRLICDNGRGIPRRLNMLADNSMLIAYADGDRQVAAGHVKECLKDFEKKFGEKASPGKATRNGVRLPWILFSILLTMTLVYLSYEFGKRQVLGHLAPEVLPLSSLAEERQPADTPPGTGSDSIPMDTNVMTPVPVLPVIDLAEQNPVDAFPLVGNDGLPQTFTEALNLSQIRAALARAPRIAYRIQPGDQFNRLTQKLSGRRDPLFLTAVREMNPHIQNFDHIRPGWILFFPDPENDHE